MGGLVQFLWVIKGNLGLASSSCLTFHTWDFAHFWHLLFLRFSSKQLHLQQVKRNHNLGGATPMANLVFWVPQGIRCLFWESLSLHCSLELTQVHVVFLKLALLT